MEEAGDHGFTACPGYADQVEALLRLPMKALCGNGEGLANIWHLNKHCLPGYPDIFFAEDHNGTARDRFLGVFGSVCSQAG